MIQQCRTTYNIALQTIIACGNLFFAYRGTLIIAGEG